MNLKDALNMLLDREGWRFPSQRPVFDDEVTYRDTGIYFYMDQNGVTYRDRNIDKYNNAIYSPNPLSWAFLFPFTISLQRYMEKKRNSRPTES